MGGPRHSEPRELRAPFWRRWQDEHRITTQSFVKKLKDWAPFTDSVS